MRLLTVEGPGQVAISYMWLPTFISLNTPLLQAMEEKIRPLLIGKELTDDTLDAANEAVIDYIEDKFQEIEGLRDYLDALKFVKAS